MDSVQKAQIIRLADVFFIGPLMLYSGYLLTQKSHPLLGKTLAALGVATVVYNGQNYIAQKLVNEVHPNE